MTYVNGGATTESYGVVTSAQTGYNKISGGAVALANASWGVNNVIFIQVDASAITSDINKVTLSMESSGSTDSKRKAGIGVGYNASAWSETLTWDTADRSITQLGGQLWTTTKSATVFEAMSFDITDAFKDDADKIVTILVYNTEAAGNNIQNVKAEVEYTKADEVLVNYSFDDAENPVMVADGSNDNRGTCNYDFASPIDGAKFLNVWGENKTNGFKVATISTSDITSNGQWTLEFDWAGYSGANGKAGQTKLVDLEGNTFFSIDDAAGWGGTFSLSTGQTVECYPCNKETRISANTASVLELKYWHHFTVIGTANGVSVTVEQYGKDESDNITKTVVVKNAKASATNVTPASIGLRPGSCGSVAIDNLKLTVGDLKIVSHDYTVKFVDQNGDAVKADEVRNAVDGEVLAVTDADKETIIEGKTQYTYVSDDAAERVVDADDMVLTITYNKTTVSDYVVNFIDGEGNPLKDAVTHKNIVVGTEVSATQGELSKILKEGVFYNYASGNDQITIAEDASANVINLVFAPVDGVTGYFYNNYENRAVDWTTATSGRYDPIVVDGSTIADRATTEKKPVLDPETGETIEYEEVPGLDIPFANKSYFLTVNQGSRNNNGATLTSKAISVDQDNYTFEAKILLGSSNDQAGTTLTLFNKAGDAAILKLQQNGQSATSWKVNDDAENLLELPNSGTATGTTNDNLNNLSWYNFKVTVYNGYTYLTVTDEAGAAIFDKKEINTVATSYGLGNMTFASSRYYANFAIDDVVVRSVVTSEDIPAGAEFFAVKINYVDANGKALKAADEQNFQKGATITLNSAFTADFKVTEAGEVWTAESEAAPVTKYIYVSDDAADVEVAENAEVNVVFRGVGPRRIALRPQIQLADGNMATKDAAGTNLPLFYDSNKTGDVLFEGDVLTFYYPYYMLVDGLLYKTGANGGNADHGTLEIEAGTGTQIKSPVTWTPATETVPVLDEDDNPMVDPETEQPITRDEQISNAVFAQETENIEGITPVKDQYTTIRMANGAAGSAIGGDVLVTTLEPGTYTITTATRSGTTNFKAAGNVVATITSSGTVTTVTSEEFTVDQTTPLYIEEQASITQYSDYVLVRKTGDVETNEITLVAGMENGVVVVPEAAAAGATIKPVFTPAKGYELESSEITVKDADGADVAVSDGAFTMPASAVTVTVNATFVPKKIYIETDLTSDFAALTSKSSWKSENAAGVGEAKWAAPQVTVAGNKYYMIENYVEGQAVKEATGGVMYNEITGLTPGLYTIELYGSAALTAGRSDMTTDFTEGDDASLSAVYLYAEANGEKVKRYIPCLIESNFNNRGGEESIPTATLDNVVVGNDGKIKIGLYKEVGLTNWHIVQLKSVTAKVLASDLLAASVAKAQAIEETTVPAALYSSIQEVISANNKAYDTAEEYEAAIKAIDDVTAKAVSYAPLTSVINEGESYKANVPAESPAIAAYEEAVAAIKTAYDAVEVADIAAAVATVEAALPAIAKAQTAPGSDFTILMNSTAWTCPQGNGPGVYQTVYTETYNASAYQPGKVIYQKIEGLAPGAVYEVKFLAVANSARGASNFGDDLAQVYANTETYDISVIEQNGCTPTEYERTLTATVGEDGVLEYGMQNVAAGGNWYVVKGVSLTLQGIFFNIEVAQTEHGTLDLPAKAAAGETVTITVTPADGYELASISVTGVTSNIAVETQYDSWDGIAEFEMPADAVTVNATFQEAYVKVSDFAIASTGIFDEDGAVKVTGTFTPETAGSYTELFFGDVIYDITVVPTAGGDAVQYTLNIPNDKTLADGVVSGYIPHLVPATNYTVYVDSVHVWDYLSYQEIFIVKAGEGEHLTSTTFTAMPQTELAELNVERYVGQGYTATTAEVDFSAAKTFLGVDEITSDMLYIINPDFSQIKDYAPYDGWFATDGTATTWDDLNATDPVSPGVCVKFYQAISEGEYAICDMNGADVVDNTYTVRWALVNNFKAYVYTINVKFVPQPVIYLADYTQEGETVDVNIYANTGNVTFDGADSEAFQESAVSTLIGEDWEDVYGVGAKVDNQETMTDNYSCNPAPGFWCLADGTADQWANGTFGVSLIWDDSFSTFNFRAWTKGDISDVLSTTFYLVNNNTKKYVAYRVILNTVPTGIDATPAADGVKPDGKYLENGKIVIYKNGNKYDASGAPMNK